VRAHSPYSTPSRIFYMTAPLVPFEAYATFAITLLADVPHPAEIRRASNRPLPRLFDPGCARQIERFVRLEDC